MKLSEDSLKLGVMVIAAVVVAVYNIEYRFPASYPTSAWDYLYKLIAVSLVSYGGIITLVILPSGVLLGKLERMIDDVHLPIGQRYTALTEALPIVSCITIIVITTLFWLSRLDLHFISLSKYL